MRIGDTVAQGKDVNTCKVRECMTGEVLYGYDDDVEDITEDMTTLCVRRMPIVNREKRLVGIVSVGDLAVKHEPARTGDTSRAIASAP